MEHVTLLIGIVIVTALFFDFTNGFHDTANAMATTIATGALRPRFAVGLSAVLNLAGAFLSVEVANTISSGIIDEGSGIRPQVVFAGLVGAIVWNLLTWLAGLPSSSSHALFGGLIGAAVASLGFSAVNGDAVVVKVLIPAVASPLVAGCAAWLATRLTYRVGRLAGNEQGAAKGYRAGQIASACLVSLAHGTNDAQKGMGVITLVLISGHVLAPGSNPPVWVICAAGVAMALGTYTGGWRIIRTLGKGITDIEPPQGFAAQTGAATVILASSHFGFSLSTTHVVSGSVLGTGLGRSGSRVRWSTAGRMAMAWLLTLPAAGLVGAGAALLADQGRAGVTAVAVLAALVCLAVRRAALRRRVDSGNVISGASDAADAAGTAGAPGAPGASGASGAGAPVPAAVAVAAQEAPGVVTTALAAVAPPPVGPAPALTAVPGLPGLSGHATAVGGTAPDGGAPLATVSPLPAHPGPQLTAAAPADPAQATA
jgi:PiT family inorganic phosphate transporter